MAEKLGKTDKFKTCILVHKEMTHWRKGGWGGRGAEKALKGFQFWGPRFVPSPFKKTFWGILLQSGLIVRLRKDSFWNFTSVRVYPGKSELIRLGLASQSPSGAVLILLYLLLYVQMEAYICHTSTNLVGIQYRFALQIDLKAEKILTQPFLCSLKNKVWTL